MIRTFKDKKTEAVFNGERPKGFPADLVKVARRKLAMVRAAMSLDDLKSPPGNKLHPLTGDRAGQHAIWINDQFRVRFVWRNGDAHDVEVVDYH
jgi:proteic killer suppression protein